MTSNVKPIPDGYSSVTPLLTVKGAGLLTEFLKRAFGATERFRMNWPDGTVAHSELQIGSSIIMLGEAHGESRPTTATIYLYVDRADETFRRALDAGAVSLREPANEFWGDRQGGVRDPAGNVWWIATHVEDVSPEEMARRGQEWLKQQSKAA
jgi:PhnB protein